MNANSALMLQLWQGLSETSALAVQKALSDLVLRNKSELAQAFYGFMMDDPCASPFLSVKSVEDRLKPGMERWLERLFCHESGEELEAVLAMQRHIGAVHARAEIPVHLVARGMRLLKHEIITLLLKTRFSRVNLIHSILRTDRLIDIAFEEMSAAFVLSHDADVRVDEAYRMFAASNNLALERERQFGALLEWENCLFRSVATDLPLDQLSTLNNSAFGLWLHHKATLIFDETRELSLIDDSMRRIDETFLLLIAHSRDRKLQSVDVRSVVKAVMAEMEQLKFLLAIMFERLTDLEVGRDVLTQLFNRRFLQTILKREIELNRRKKSPFCVLMLDIDFFKHVNDQQGHDAGDRVLQGIACLLINQVRVSDFVFRYGGEEFLIVLAEVDGLQAQEVAEKIRRRVEAAEIPLATANTIKVTLSIGIAEFDGHPDYQRMIDRADKALYAAKSGGRNCWALAQEQD